MTGNDLKKLAIEAGLSSSDICQESGIRSSTTLSKVFKNERVRPRTRIEAEKAIKRLVAKIKDDINRGS